MKILIVTKNWLGDVMFEIPAIETIRRHYPHAEIACIVPQRCKEVIEHHPAINRVIVFDERETDRSFGKRLRFIWQMRKEKWDQAYLFHRSRTRALFLFLAGVKERIGFGGNRHLFLTRYVKEPPPSAAIHQVDYFMALLAGIGFECPEKAAYRFYFSPQQAQKMNQILQQHQLDKYVCFHLGANWAPKRWPPTHFAKLAELIQQKWDYKIVITGAKRDSVLAEQLMSYHPKATIINLVGQTSLGELGALFKQAQFVVSGDSGPMHIASGVGAKVLTFFGPTNPDLTGPRGIGDSIVLTYVPPGFHTPWYGEPKDDWLSRIQPEQVIEAIEKKAWQPVPKSLAKMQSALHPPRILLITLSNIGDVILTTPVIVALKDQFPHSKLTVVVSPKAIGVLANSTIIDRIFIYDKKSSWKEKLHLIEELRRENYDYVVDLRNTAIPFLVNANKRSPVFRQHQEVLMRKRHLEVLKMMGLQYDNGLPHFDFYQTQDETSTLEKVREKGLYQDQGWILVAAAAASELKTWQLSGFREVLNRLLQNRNEDIVLVGGERERALVEPLVSLNPKRIFNLAGETNLKELAVLVNRSTLLLTNDSAAMHLGFEMQRPVVAIFGPTSPQKYGREGRLFRIIQEKLDCVPCESSHCRFARQACLDDLNPEKVYQACLELLQQSTPVLQ